MRDAPESPESPDPPRGLSPRSQETLEEILRAHRERPKTVIREGSYRRLIRNLRKQAEAQEPRDE